MIDFWGLGCIAFAFTFTLKGGNIGNRQEAVRRKIWNS